MIRQIVFCTNILHDCFTENKIKIKLMKGLKMEIDRFFYFLDKINIRELGWGSIIEV